MLLQRNKSEIKMRLEFQQSSLVDWYPLANK